MRPQNSPAKNDRFEDYIPVAERIEKFYERFPEGRIVTQIVEHDRESGFVLVRAEVYRGPDDAVPSATGHAYEYKDAGYVQRTSYIEVAETSAVGRGLAFLNFEVKRGIASREEMEKAARKQAAGAKSAPAPEQAGPAAAAAEPAGLEEQILQAAVALGYDEARVRKWVNQKFEVTGGLASLTDADRREVLRIFREKAGAVRVAPLAWRRGLRATAGAARARTG